MALGELSATLAHEIRTPLVNIGGFTARLRKELGAKSCGKYIDQMSKEVTRLESIINDILSVADERKLNLKPHSVSALITGPIELFKDSCANHNIKVEVKLTNSASLIMADIEQIRIAFDNLIANAIQSMDKGGRLTISNRKKGDFTVITISDSGGGIPSELMGDIFNPFFTTKERGTGLGLTITHKIVARHGGWIEAANNTTRGVSFTVGLRRCKDEKPK
jgi:signal transduction histidine kinase